MPWLPLLVAALFTTYLAALISHHEMWRDEMQGWLLARDSATPFEMLRAMKYEGHPPLWHLMLWPLAHLTWNPVWMQALHVALAGASGLLVFRFSPFPWPVRLLLMGGYLFSYEWAVISRNYAIIVVIVFGICVLYEKRHKRYVALGLLLGLLCLTHAAGLIIAVAITGTLALEFALSWLRGGGARQRAAPFAAGVVLVVLAMTAAIWQASPPIDAGFAHPARTAFHMDDARRLAGAVIDGYLPVPVAKITFWNSNRFLGQDNSKGPQPLRIPESHRIAVAAMLLAFGALLVVSRPWMLIPFVLATAAQLAFSHMYYFGNVRHHGLLFLVLVATLWMSFAHRPPGDGSPALASSFRSRVAAILALLDRHRMTAFALLLVVHVWGAAVAIPTDWEEPFSQGRAAAEWLAEKIPDRSAVLFVGDRSPNASTVLGYLELDRMYYPDRSDFGSYVIYDRIRIRRRRRTLSEEVLDLIREHHKPAVLVLSHEMPEEAGFGDRAKLVHRFGRAIQADEHYWIYVVAPKSEESGT